MVSRSKARDPRFWKKWRDSGAVWDDNPLSPEVIGVLNLALKEIEIRKVLEESRQQIPPEVLKRRWYL